MRRWSVVLLALAFAACKRGGAPAPEPQISLRLLPDGGMDFETGAISAPEIALPSLAPLVDRISPSVVSLSVVGTATLPPGHVRLFGGRRMPQQERTGSGFIVDGSGLLVTNNHVVEGASTIQVRLADGRRFDADLVGRDAPTDLALVRLRSPPDDLPVARLGDSDRLHVGDWVLAIGSPFGLTTSVSLGILSARARDLGSGPYDEFLQTDAAINPGNSGGPLFDLSGEVVGVNTAIVNSQSGGRIGFAIPSSEFRALLPQLERTGGVVRGALGVYTQDLTPDLARAMGLEGRRGAVVNGFIPGSSGRAAGLSESDVIVSLDGRPIESARALTRLVGLHRPGETVKLGVVRGTQSSTVSVRLGRRTDLEGAGPLRPSPPGDEEEETPPGQMVPMRLGVEIGEVTPEVEAAVGVRGAGALVLSVEPGSPAERAGLQPGLVIVEVAGHPVHSAKEASELIRAAEAQPPLVFRLLGPGRVSAVASVDP
ncbi:MAG TPA: trypsin-like peptidase domain-containing protein [Myxococcaceae bacterium]|nr:trypsin-like peptidase domain-containing protein [Myxococcaceae bacterium]